MYPECRRLFGRVCFKCTQLLFHLRRESGPGYRRARLKTGVPSCNVGNPTSEYDGASGSLDVFGIQKFLTSVIEIHSNQSVNGVVAEEFPG